MRYLKTALIVLVILAVSSNVFAVNYKTINSGSIKAFIEIFPAYRALLESQGDNIDPHNAYEVGAKFKKEIESLLKPHGITFEEFPVFMQKITMGYSAVQMKRNGIDPHAMGIMNGSNISDKEMNVISNNFSELERVISG